MADWGFLTSYARVLICIAHDPGARLRDIAASLGITERSACGILVGLAGPVRDQAERWPPATATRSRRTHRDNQRAEARRRAGKALDPPEQHSGSGW